MMKKGTKAKWGNQIGYLIYPFTIALWDNPLGYLREAKAAMDRKKASLEASFSYFLAKYFLKFGGMKVQLLFFSFYYHEIYIVKLIIDSSNILNRWLAFHLKPHCGSQMWLALEKKSVCLDIQWLI